MDGDRCGRMRAPQQVSHLQTDLKGCKHLNKPVIFTSRLSEFSLQDLRSQGQSCRLQTIPSKLDTTICSCSRLLHAEHCTNCAARLFFVLIDFWRLNPPIFFFDMQRIWSKNFVRRGGEKNMTNISLHCKSARAQGRRTSSGGRNSPLLCTEFFGVLRVAGGTPLY